MVPQLHVWCLGIPDSIKMPSFNLITVRKCGFWTVFFPLYSVIINISVLLKSVINFIQLLSSQNVKELCILLFYNRFIRNPFVIKVALACKLAFFPIDLFISTGMTNVSLVLYVYELYHFIADDE